MNEIHEELTSTEAVSPAYIFPQNKPATIAEIYGTPAITEVVESSEINNPDGPSGSNSVVPASGSTAIQAGGSTLATVSNPKPYFWPDLTNMSPGSWHSTPYTGAPQPVTNQGRG
jgi:hypothetical protein